MSRDVRALRRYLSMRKPVHEGKRIGIYAGTFDPVHAGHIAFALQAMKEAKLDEVIFLPERKPRFKDGVEHFGHRVAMLNRAIRPYRQLGVMEMVDRHFTVRRTLPQLLSVFRGARLVFLFGSDVAEYLGDWAGIEQLCAGSEIVVGVRGSQSPEVMRELLAKLPAQPQQLHVFKSYAAEVSSGSVREALRRGQPARGMLASVRRYARRNWLYVSFR